MTDPSAGRTSPSLEENMSKTLAEFLILYILSEQERYIGEITAVLEERSSGIIHIDSTYFFITRAYQAGYIVESGKHIAPDGRRRQYYRITEAGLARLEELRRAYDRVLRGVTDILQRRGNTP